MPSDQSMYYTFVKDNFEIGWIAYRKKKSLYPTTFNLQIKNAPRRTKK